MKEKILFLLGKFGNLIFEVILLNHQCIFYRVSGVLFISQTLALYQSTDVIELTQSNFEKLVLKSDEIWIVEFYAPWCGHCQQLVPEYKKAAAALKVCNSIFVTITMNLILIYLFYLIRVL